MPRRHCYALGSTGASQAGYSITSSTRSRNAADKVRPIAFTVFILTISSNFVGALDGQVGRLGALKDLIDITRALAV